MESVHCSKGVGTRASYANAILIIDIVIWTALDTAVLPHSACHVSSRTKREKTANRELGIFEQL